jgi:ATP-dependent 26S proteasome regulatory subunit
MDGMLELQKFKTRLPGKEIDLGLNYGPVAEAKFQKILSLMDSGRNGLVLLSGHPGTGKSTFIKMLSMKTDRKVIYLSSSSAEHLTNPEFLSFMMRHRDSILLLEDAEKVLRSRDEQDNSAISNLLNITDGILGDCLNIMVLATFNIDREKIDSALVRKGRLLVEHHFEPLQPDMANNLLESLGSDVRVSSPTSLAEIYNPEDNFHEEKEENKVGF